MTSLTEEKRAWWTIDVTGYGTFTIYATEKEADDKRRAKAAWEGGSGRVRAAEPDEIEGAKEHIRWRHANEYPVQPGDMEALQS